MCDTLVMIVGSSARARSCAVREASSRPQNRSACTRPANAAASGPSRSIRRSRRMVASAARPVSTSSCAYRSCASAAGWDRAPVRARMRLRPLFSRVVTQRWRRRVFRDEAMAACQPRPGRREIRRLLDARLIRDRARFPSGRPRWPPDWRGHTAPAPARWTACRVACGFVSRHRARCPPACTKRYPRRATVSMHTASSASASSLRSVETLTVRFASSTAVSRPDCLQQLLLRQQAAGVAKKHHERVEDLRRDGKRRRYRG